MALTVQIITPATDPLDVLQGQLVHFEATVSGQGSGASLAWSWGFGDGSPSDTANPTDHAFASKGTYTVTATCTATYPNGSTEAASDTTTVNVSGVLAVRITSPTDQDTLLTCARTFSFVPTVTGGKSPYTYEWRFGDGSYSTLESPSHTYGGSGYFDVSVTVKDALGQQASDLLQLRLQGVVKLQYQLPGSSNWLDLPGAAALEVLIGTTLRFKAVKALPDPTGWPAGQPVWSGVVSASGQATIAVTFNELSRSDTDYKRVVVSCGFPDFEANIKVILYGVTVDFLWPANSAIVGPWDRNDPRPGTPGIRPRQPQDPDKCSTRFIIKTQGKVDWANDRPVLRFRHLEPNTRVNPNPVEKSGGSVAILEADNSATPTWIKYHTFIQLNALAAGWWEVEVDVLRYSMSIAPRKRIRVYVRTTVEWPWLSSGGTPVYSPVGSGLHGRSIIRPGSRNPLNRDHKIPVEDQDRSDAVDVNAGGTGRGIAPFNARIVTARRLSHNDPSLGYYVRLDGEIKTTTGISIRYVALMAHIDIQHVQGATRVCVGQPIGNQTTERFLHFGMYDAGTGQLVAITGDLTLVPGDRAANAWPSAPDKNNYNLYWDGEDAEAYHNNLVVQLRAALRQRRFGH